MPLYRATITPETPFKSLIKGDTLFGYMCWEYKNAFGESALLNILQNYHITPPFVMSDAVPVVISDAVPVGYIPRPQMPLHMLGITAKDEKIKLKKKIAYMPDSVLKHPVKDWFTDISDTTTHITPDTRTHNSINRQTHTTGTADDGGQFAPYDQDLIYLHGDGDGDICHKNWYIYIAIPDTSVISLDTVKGLLTTIGFIGYGASKTRGLGKFRVPKCKETQFTLTGNAFLTLAPHKPNPDYGVFEKCFYKPFTRFGKVGDVGVFAGNPFKSPILMADVGAVITPKTYMANTLYIGSGVGGMDKDGKGYLSATIPHMVHQGYSPIIPITI